MWKASSNGEIIGVAAQVNQNKIAKSASERHGEERGGTFSVSISSWYGGYHWISEQVLFSTHSFDSMIEVLHR